MESLNTSEEISESPFDVVPNEVLEFILSFLPPYKDLETCMSVCKRWDSCAKNVIRKTEQNLYKAIKDIDINWKTILPLDTGPSITKRFSHSACVHDNSMYIFGGCTNNTAFNDLWRFDLSERKWVRPIATGTYPTPKAYATMVPYKQFLILFGGWSYPSSTTAYICLNTTSEVHFYNTVTNHWSRMNTTNIPPLLAGHSATIHNDTMVIFGGLCKLINYQAPAQSNSDVWVLDLKSLTWTNQLTSNPKPSARHGQSLIKLDNSSIMILGGLKTKIFDDCWILKMTGSTWKWFEIPVKNKQWSTTQIWCNPACRVGDKVITLSYEQKKPFCLIRLPHNPLRPRENITTHRLEENMKRPVDRDNNVNGRRGVLPHQREISKPDSIVNANLEPQAGPSNIRNLELRLPKPNDIVNKNNSDLFKMSNEANSSSQNSGSVSSLNNNENPNGSKARGLPGKRPLSNGNKILRRIRVSNDFRMAAFACDPSIHNIPPPNNFFNHRIIQRHQELQQAVNIPDLIPAVKKLKRNTMTMHILDISSILNDEPYDSVSWMPSQSREIDGAPEEVMMYSLVLGKGELIMFGGFHCHAELSSDISIHSTYPNFISNALHFLIPPRSII